MRIVEDFPRPVRLIENDWVTMPDGIRLAVRIWLPEDAEADPVPAVLEAIPYRKDDWTARRDALQHPYVAGHGYAVVRLDLRGSGSSDGVLLDEYLPQEQDDIEAVIAWIAEQPWCTGAVGMTGISWGGFNALQVAARRPPALKAIMTLCSTDDRYADDVHYIGGCVLAIDALPWASQMLVWNAAPPDPLYAGDGWRDRWLERLEQTPPFVEAWLSHQRRDAYWKHGSVCEDFAAVECPVYAVGGWADGYTNAIFRLLEGLPGPRKGLVGPWAHGFPHDGLPGPAVGFLQECVRWWDRWLKGIDNGIDEEPMLRAWIQDPVPGRAHHAERPGRWVAEESWPPSAAIARIADLRARRRHARRRRPAPRSGSMCAARSSAGSTRGSGARTEMPRICRRTRGSTTVSRSASIRRRSRVDSSCSASPRRGWRLRPTARRPSSPSGSATSPRPASRRWSRPACSTSRTARVTSIPRLSFPASATT